MSTQAESPIAIVKSPAGDDVFHLKSLRGEEHVSRLFRYELELLCKETDVEFKDLVGQPLGVELYLGEEPIRIEALGVPVITDKVDIANVRVEFPSGCIADMVASRVSRVRWSSIPRTATRTRCSPATRLPRVKTPNRPTPGRLR